MKRAQNFIFNTFLTYCLFSFGFSDENESFAIPNTNLEFASLCLRNALTLIEHYESEFKTNDENETNKDDDDEPIIPCNPSQALTRNSFQQLKYAVLAAYSYVLISLGDYLLALKYGQQLASTSDLPDAYA